jgi:hypothetical protein
MLDPFITEVCHGVGWSWRVKFAGAVRSSTVVVPDVVREHHTQVPLTKDQYPVGDFGSDRADEPFGEAVRPRTTRRNPDDADADVSKDSVEEFGELTGRSRTRNRNCVMRSPRSIARLRICWVVHRPSGLVVAPSRCTDRLATSKVR